MQYQLFMNNGGGLEMLQKLKNNNNGSVEITRVICYFYLVCVIAFVLDIVVVIGQNVVTSYEAAYYAEKVSIQGGLLGDTREYPSVNEVNGTNGNACYNYKKPCSGCLTNSVMASRITKTLGYFGVSNTEWEGKLEAKGSTTVFKTRGNQTAGMSSRKPLNYMTTATFILSTDWNPIFAKWLWGKESYTIEKYVPLVIEYIPGPDPTDTACKNVH